MGILIGDTLTLRNGLTCENTYGCIASDTVSIRKEVSTLTIAEAAEGGDETTEPNTETTVRYILSGKGVIWATKEMRNNYSPKLKYDNLAISFDDTSFLSNNVFTLLYTKWKENFTSATDDI
jgi:hypothetical protein